jgi:hypothetical protein
VELSDANLTQVALECCDTGGVAYLCHGTFCQSAYSKNDKGKHGDEKNYWGLEFHISFASLMRSHGMLLVCWVLFINEIEATHFSNSLTLLTCGTGPYLQ